MVPGMGSGLRFDAADGAPAKSECKKRKGPENLEALSA
jgi:hypothetical protein